MKNKVAVVVWAVWLPTMHGFANPGSCASERPESAGLFGTRAEARKVAKRYSGVAGAGRVVRIPATIALPTR